MPIRLINLFVKPFYISSIIAHVLACQLKFHTITLYKCMNLIPVGHIADDTCAAVIKSKNKQHKCIPKPPVKPRGMYAAELQTYINIINLNNVLA